MPSAYEREQLKSCLAVELAKVTKMEDRIRDLLAQFNQQAEMLHQRQETIVQLQKTIDRSSALSQATALANERQQEMLVSAKNQTAQLHEDHQQVIRNLQAQLKQWEAELSKEKSNNQNTIDQLRKEVEDVRQEKKTAVEAIGRLQETQRRMKRDITSASEQSRARRQTIVQLEASLAKRRHYLVVNETIDSIRGELKKARREFSGLQRQLKDNQGAATSQHAEVIRVKETSKEISS